MHEPNQPITVESTDIVEMDGQSMDVTVNIMFRLLPFPAVVIEADELPNLVLKKERFEIALANGARLEAMVRSFNLGTRRGSLIPARQPVNVIDKGAPLRLLHFSILNFPEFFGQHDQWSGDRRLGVAKLQAGPWITKITAAPNLDKPQKTLKADGGYAVTHTGLITRSDGGIFSVEDVEKFLSGLRAFLPLARGTSCGLANVEGKDQHGGQCWVRWGGLTAHSSLEIYSVMFGQSGPR